MQKTAYELRISDWSSDVCSSDLLFGLQLDQARARHHHGLLDRRSYALAARHHRRRAQVFNARIGAGADENAIHLDFGKRCVWRQTHLLQGALPASAPPTVLFIGISRTSVRERGG